ncbi:MAG: GNAT family N-acetyltransferase [Caldilineaceae bacterium]
MRRQSLNPEPIALETHLAWFAARLQSQQTRIWIVRNQGIPVAQIRYDVTAPSIDRDRLRCAASHRGQGIGTWLLAATHDLACRTLNVTRVRGIVRQSNPASARAFEKAGFQKIGSILLKDIDCRIYERMCAPPVV